MKELKQLKKYDFHDSLIEDIICDNEHNKVILKLDFCNWKQTWYNESDEETKTLTLTFENVSNVVMPELSLNDDEIIEIEISSENGVKFVAFNDVKNIAYEIIINADKVRVI